MSYNVWNNGYALRSRDGCWVTWRDFDTREQAEALLRFCVWRQQHLPKHLQMNYEVKERKSEDQGSRDLRKVQKAFQVRSGDSNPQRVRRVPTPPKARARQGVRSPQSPAR